MWQKLEHQQDNGWIYDETTLSSKRNCGKMGNNLEPPEWLRENTKRKERRYLRSMEDLCLKSLTSIWRIGMVVGYG